jgi:hypothetical protein
MVVTTEDELEEPNYSVSSVWMARLLLTIKGFVLNVPQRLKLQEMAVNVPMDKYLVSCH